MGSQVVCLMQEHLNAPPKELLLAQTEHYVEYSRKGKVIKGEEKPIIRSRYEEDRSVDIAKVSLLLHSFILFSYHNNHTSVWGSYWKSGQWGYECCHSVVKNSYCVGEFEETTFSHSRHTVCFQ